MKAKLIIFSLLLCVSAQAQFSHVVLIIQENRTPDNLFGSCPPVGSDVLPIGDSVALGTTGDIPHSHASFKKESSGIWPSLAKNYVQNSDVRPYCDLAALYGFANRMFQTNQGPSGPAHDFLFGGTSAPSYPGQLHDDWFASENGGNCIGQLPTTFIDPVGSTHSLPGCKDHDTLGDLLSSAGISWRYYTPSAGNLWTAPVTVRHICQPVSGHCTGPQWANVVLNPSAVQTDISAGTLAQVSWVIPAGDNSDHPNYGSGGPAWVSSIVNSIGASPYWQDTAIIVVWDDWGGWYDHVPPMVNGTGWCPSYCFGFRVPMLAISSRTPAGYISNVNMDFGSILKFVENNFGLPLLGNGTYADAYAQFDMGLFGGLKRPRATFKKVDARKLTQAELSSTADPDDD